MKSARLAGRMVLVLGLVATACNERSETTRPNQEGEPHAITQDRGDQQQGVVAMPLPESMVVKVVDVAGRGVAGVPVEFTVVSGGGWITPEGEQVTDESGRASVTWYMGPRPSQGEVILGATSPVGGTGFRAYASPLLPGRTYHGADGWTELRVGDLPLILTAGHGGTESPAAIADHTHGETAVDPHTVPLVEAIEDELYARSEVRPTVVVSHLARRKADMDRPLAEATAGSPAAKRAWREYHGFIAAARARLHDDGERGLVVDVHGHDGDGSLQMGYLLTAADLALSDAELNALEFWQKSSIRELVHSNTPPFSYIVRSESSLGGILEDLGMSATPAPARRSPDPATYEPGAHTVESHGSRSGDLVSALSLQVPASLRESAAARADLASVLADALDAFFSGFYGAALTDR